MRKFVLSALILYAYPLVSLGAVQGQWTYIIENGGATIITASATGAVTIPSQLGGYAVKQVGDKFGDTPIFGFPNTSVTSLVIPSSVKSIGSSAFSGCRSLTSITIPNSVTSIGYAAFSSCSGLTSITIGNSVTSIGGAAFYGCSALRTITIPNSVTSIESNAFQFCSGLTSITIGNGVTSIGNSAFWDCTSLTSITIPSSVTSIGSYAFRACTSLTSITIPSSVTSIGVQAFEFCDKLVTVYLPARFSETYRNLSLTPAQVYFGTTATLTASCNPPEGTILVSPNKSPYDVGESAVVTATPKAGYLFSNWSGASTATTSSITLTMDEDKTVTANFIQDGGDNDGDGLTNYRESVTFGTNPNVAETTSPVAGLYLANQMQAMAIGDLVLTKNANGSFTLNYDIEKSDNLQTWTTYQALSLPLTGLPTNKAFVRIKMINTITPPFPDSSPNSSYATPSASNL